MEIQDYVIKKIGQNKGAPRIWLDGQQAIRAGFAPGGRYELTVNGESITLEARKDGSRAVSRRLKGETELPIIDINSAALLQIFDGMDSVRMVVAKGKVIFLPLASEKAKKERITRLRTKLTNGEPLLVIHRQRARQNQGRATAID